MINVYPFGIPSAQQPGFPIIPFVFGIPSAEAFGSVNIPRFAGISSEEKFGSPTVGIWWLRWREFDRKNMYSKTYQVFATTDARFDKVQLMMIEAHPELAWKVTTRVFGETSNPSKYGSGKLFGAGWKYGGLYGKDLKSKTQLWNHTDIFLREGLY